MALLLNANDSVNRSYTITKPSPNHPLDVNGVGERTANIFDGTLLGGHFLDANFKLGGNTSVFKSIKVFLPAGTYTFSWGKNVNIVRKIIDGSYSENLATNVTSYTVTSTTDDHVGISFRDTTSSSTVWDVATPIMLNTGSTAKPYEPYGYKIPILNGQQTTNIYLGSTQTVRQIKQLVFTGNERFTNSQITGGYRARLVLQDVIKTDARSLSLCSHFPYQLNWTVIPGFVPGNNGQEIYFMSEYSDFASYCAQQYANGTPVTVCYIIATPETATVNEPLMKIGDYADTLSNAASIPTTEGANSITVDTTVQPSEFTATWTGWHNAYVKEWDGSEWNE